MAAKLYKSFIALDGHFFTKAQSYCDIASKFDEYSFPHTARGFFTLIGDRCVNKPSLEQMEAFLSEEQVDLTWIVDFSRAFPDFYFNISGVEVKELTLSANKAYSEIPTYLGSASEVEAAGVELPKACTFIANSLTPNQELLLSHYVNNPSYSWSVIYL